MKKGLSTIQKRARFIASYPAVKSADKKIVTIDRKIKDLRKKKQAEANKIQKMINAELKKLASAKRVKAVARKKAGLIFSKKK
jgi:vacuolar-type H+-ATPase subunit I/STV1